MFYKRFLVCLGVVLAASACAQGPALQAGQTHPNIELLASSELPVPSGFDTSDPARPYLIGPFDRLK